MEENKKVEAEVAEVKATETPVQEQEVAKAKCCGGKFDCKKHGLAAAVIILVILLVGSFAYKQYRTKVDIGSEAVKAKVQKFLSENVPPSAKTEIKDITADGSLYKITILIDKQEVPVYATKDGLKLIQAQGVVDLDRKAADKTAQQQPATPEKTEAENKADVPTVDLFVMSYCPYGTQIEKGILPVLKTLGSKIKFNLKFVDYAMHGDKEIDENLRQYCITKTQPAKLDDYLTCFLKKGEGTADACLKTAGINAAQITTCVAATDKQFNVKADAADKSKWDNPTYPPFNIFKDENTKFGVQGSPTLLVNGTTLTAPRDSAGLLKAICSGFNKAPKECATTLSATAPAPGFGDGAAPAGSASAGAACGN